MINNGLKFITANSLMNMSWDQVSQWYSHFIGISVRTYLTTPSAYQREKNKKHLGTVCLFDPAFTSKYLSQTILNSQVGSAAICGTLGLDNNGRPSLWFQNNESIGQLWAEPTDKGTNCNLTKIVLLEDKPDIDLGQLHAFPIENVNGYRALYFSENLLTDVPVGNRLSWVTTECNAQGSHLTQCGHMEDKNVIE